MLRILLGGSPCTHWSIAQSKNRETTPSGLGWELFKNYLIAKERFKPDFFLYENNVSASEPIKAQIRKELGAWDIDYRFLVPGQTQYIEINSALVSAQKRQRFYVHNFPGVELPEDRGILLRDVLDNAISDREKAYTLRASAGTKQGVSNILRHIKSGGQFGYQGVFEPVPLSENEMQYMCGDAGKYGNRWNFANNVEAQKARCITANIHRGVPYNVMIEPVRIGTIENEAKGDHDSKQYRVYSPEGKATTLCGEGGGVGAKTGLYACPIEVEELDTDYYHGDKSTDVFGKIVCKNTSDNKGQPAQCTRIYRTDRKSICLDGDGRKYIIDNYSPNFTSTNKEMTIYEVKNGLINIKGTQYPIKLPDGFYIIRKFTVAECRRLQTIPDWYIMPCSNTQNYKMLGNGWTVEVPKHIMQSVAGQEVEVLSMYDGMSCGRIALEELGCKVRRYYAYEIDKYSIQTTQANFPDTIQLGDAFGIATAQFEA